MRMRCLFAAALLGVVSLPAAASAHATAHAAIHPVSGLPIVPLKVTGEGKVHTFRVEVAATPQQQEKGLMFRTAMGQNEGMIFPMQPARYAAFWMHNTVLPLDIIFIGTDGRIMTIAADCKPYDDSQIPSGGMASGVLELNAGRAAQLGMQVGDKVTW